MRLCSYTSDMIRFRHNDAKTLEALVFLAKERPGIDVFHICKVLYFADKEHLNRYGRPILGDRYFALREGPVPSRALNMVNRNQLALSGDVLEQLSNALSLFQKNGEEYAHLDAKRDPDYDQFSETDIECLNWAIQKFADLSLRDLWNIAHQENSYNAAWERRAGNRASMDYALMVNPDNPLRDEILEDIQENSRVIGI